MRAPRVDANQRRIVEALEAVGASVASLAGVGRGCPDLLVGYHGRNFLLEVKNMDRRGWGLTKDQDVFHVTWKGQTAVVGTVADALQVIGFV